MTAPRAVRRGGPRLLVGTSGFSYPSWRGTFYPEDMPARRWLAFYAKAFRTVEINNTFYRMPSPALLAGWRTATPPGFRFALKVPQRITHHLRLKDAEEPIARFCTAAAELGTQCGPLLFQLPPHLRADPPRLAAALAALPQGVEAAVEFRHPSWFTDETWTTLADHGAALCIADGEALTTPFETTASFGYLRLRRADYEPDALAEWARRVRDVGKWRCAYVYLKHDEAGRAPALANTFLAAAS